MDAFAGEMALNRAGREGALPDQDTNISRSIVGWGYGGSFWDEEKKTSDSLTWMKIARQITPTHDHAALQLDEIRRETVFSVRFWKQLASSRRVDLGSFRTR